LTFDSVRFSLPQKTAESVRNLFVSVFDKKRDLRQNDDVTTTALMGQTAASSCSSAQHLMPSCR